MAIRIALAGVLLLAGCVSIPPLDDAKFISVERVAAMPAVLVETPLPREKELPVLRVVFSTARPLMREDDGNFSPFGRIGFCSERGMTQVDFLWQGRVVTRENVPEIARVAEDSPPRYEVFFRYRPLPISSDPSIPIALPPPHEDLCLSVTDWGGWPVQSTKGAPLHIPHEAVATALAQPLP